MSDHEELQSAYETLPKMKSPQKCIKLCTTGKCKFECCTITGCSGKERKVINNYIRTNGLKLPFIGRKLHTGYILPHSEGESVRCLYLTENGCSIYDVRPAICRLFATVKQMTCSHMPEEGKHEEYPLKAMVKIGMISEDVYSRIEDTEPLFESEIGKPSLFDKILHKLSQ